MIDPRKILRIGIDPGKKNGYCEYRDKKIIRLETLDYWQLLSRLREVRKIEKLVKITIENPNLNKPLFLPKDYQNKLKQAVYDRDLDVVQMTMRLADRMSQNVGMNKQDATRIIQYIEMLGLPFEEYKQRKKKIKHPEFAQITGWRHRTNEHTRDAAMLVFGL